MSTVCKIGLRALEADTLEAVRQYLRSVGCDYVEEESEWPLANERDSFHVNECFPSLLSVKAVNPDVVEVHFNSFSRLKGLASYLSSSLDTPVVVNVYQSAATASYWAFYLQGECLREIEAGDGEVSFQSGIPLAFEPESPGHDISDEGEAALFIFNDDDQNDYNEQVGISIDVYQEHGPGWINFILDNTPKEQQNVKAWWRFW